MAIRGFSNDDNPDIMPADGNSGSNTTTPKSEKMERLEQEAINFLSNQGIDPNDPDLDNKLKNSLDKLNEQLTDNLNNCNSPEEAINMLSEGLKNMVGGELGDELSNVIHDSLEGMVDQLANVFNQVGQGLIPGYSDADNENIISSRNSYKLKAAFDKFKDLSDEPRSIMCLKIDPSDISEIKEMTFINEPWKEVLSDAKIYNKFYNNKICQCHVIPSEEYPYCPFSFYVYKDECDGEYKIFYPKKNNLINEDHTPILLSDLIELPPKDKPRDEKDAFVDMIDILLTDRDLSSYVDFMESDFADRNALKEVSKCFVFRSPVDNLGNIGTVTVDMSAPANKHIEGFVYIGKIKFNDSADARYFKSDYSVDDYSDEYDFYVKHKYNSRLESEFDEKLEILKTYKNFEDADVNANVHIKYENNKIYTDDEE